MNQTTYFIEICFEQTTWLKKLETAVIGPFRKVTRSFPNQTTKTLSKLRKVYVILKVKQKQKQKRRRKVKRCELAFRLILYGLSKTVKSNSKIFWGFQKEKQNPSSGNIKKILLWYVENTPLVEIFLFLKNTTVDIEQAKKKQLRTIKVLTEKTNQWTICLFPILRNSKKIGGFYFYLKQAFLNLINKKLNNFSKFSS